MSRVQFGDPESHTIVLSRVEPCDPRQFLSKIQLRFIMKSTIRSFTSLLSFFTAVMAGCCLALPMSAQESQADRPFATGLQPPTPAERAWMQSNLKKTRKVNLNRLGLARVNEHRREKGLAPLDIPVAAEGQETDSGGSGGGEGTAGTLPGAVDNSLLPSFPPVRSQGSIGSCASFSTTYYTATHMTGLARGFNNKNDTDNSTKFSPKWTYPMVNNGQNNGSTFGPTFDVLLKHGAAPWAEWPYSGVNTPSSYREWCRDGAVWRRAIQYRMAEAGAVSDVNTDAGLNDLKTLLANGYVLLYATDIYGWQYLAISDDPGTAEDNAFAGKYIAYYVTQDSSGHAMTVVGYNDNIWCDINKNGVVDAGEKGALRICNSWGTDWRPGSSSYSLGGPVDGGFTWLAYDALRVTSGVAGASTPNRAPGANTWRTAWWYNESYWLRARPSYTPQLVAQFTLNHAKRSQLGIRLGMSAANTNAPTSTWTACALSYQGGAYAFDGTTTAVNGTFAFDVSDVVTNGAARFYGLMADNAAGSSASLSDFRLLDAGGNALMIATNGVPGTADNSTALAYAALAYDPPVILNAGNTNAKVGDPFSFAIQASGNPTSYGANSLPPGLTVNSNSGVISGTPAQGGTYIASLSANNATGTGAGELIIAVGSAPVAPPGITSSSTATGKVGVAFSYTITASNSPTSFGASGLPGGLAVNTGSGGISGTPTAAGTFAVQLSANNAGGSGTRALALTINPPPATVPVITSPLTAEGRVGNPLTYRIVATNSPTNYGATGLPDELTINTGTGVISGTPTLARDYSITLRASNAAGTGYATMILSVLGDSSFGPANDSFANRTAVAGTNIWAAGDNNNASAESGEPAHAGYPASRSVWWTWTAPAGGATTVSTEGSTFDTVLAIYTGASVTNLALIAADDQSGSNDTSRATFSAAAGTAYQIAVDGFSGAMGTVLLNLQLAATPTPPANDNFASGILLTGSNIVANGRNLGASAETGEPAHAGSTATNSVWWSWTAPAAGLVSVNTMGSDFDTLLAIYTGTSVNALTPVASDDQSGPNNTSALTFNATSGTIYRIAVDGYAGAAGNIVLNLILFPGGAPPPNDNFANRIVLAGTNLVATGSNVNATAQSGEPAHAGQAAHKSVWWSWTAPSNSLAGVTTVGSTFDTMLVVYTGSSLGALVPVASSDDASGLLTSRVSFPATAGTTYQIAVDGFEGASGNITLNIQGAGAAPANDNFASASPLTGAAPRSLGANVNATFEFAEPYHAGNFPTHTVWWYWTAPTNGQMTFSTLGSDFDTVLAVYTGSSVMELTGIASVDDSDGAKTSTVTFWANAGTTYRIVVDGFGGAMGNILLTGTFSAGGDFLYATDFSSFPQGLAKLAGVDGWVGNNTLFGYMHGITTAFEGGGLGGYLGYYQAMGASPVSVYRQVNFQPVAQGKPVVYFATKMELVASTNGYHDAFAFTYYNRVGMPLASLLLQTNLHLWRNDGNGWTDTGKLYAKGTVYDLLLTVDYAANKWSAVLGRETLFTNETFHAGSQTRDLGMVAVQWYLTALYYPGNNFLLFDDYSIAAAPALSLPSIASEPQSRTNLAGSVASFTVAAHSTAPLSFQWQFNGTNLPGATAATLTLFNVTANNAGSYRALVSNAAGSVPSQSAELTVLPAPPIQLSAARMTLRGFQFLITASPGTIYTVETSTNLVQWAPLSTVQTDVSGGAFFIDSSATNGASRFYRVE
jgi:hypothetical protein